MRDRHAVQAAGGTTAGGAGDLAPDAWFNDYKLNLKASCIMVYHCLGSFTSGASVFPGMLGASFTFPCSSLYSGNKPALMQLTGFSYAEKHNLRAFTSTLALEQRLRRVAMPLQMP